MAAPSVATRRSREVLRVEGSDAQTYLQGQLSQDISVLDSGEGAYSFLLEPTGKVVAWLRISRIDEVYILDVDRGWGEAVSARLKRFLLRMDCKIEPVTWDLVTLLDTSPESVNAPLKGLLLPVRWPGMEAVDLLGPEVVIPTEITEVDVTAWEYRRIAAGIPVMGPEMDETTIPGATGVVDCSVSFTKGCYTGQELVARVDSRKAGTPTRLVRVIGEGRHSEPGEKLVVDEVEVGYLTSVAADPLGVPADNFVALAMVKRAVEVPTTIEANNAVLRLLED